MLISSLTATSIQTGDIPIRLGPPVDGVGKPEVLEPGKPRETRIFDGKTYVMETALKGDVAILRAWKVDEFGNCQFRYTTKAFGPIMAKAARVAIVEAENIVPVGSIDPNDIHLPGIYIDRIVPATAEKFIEIKKLKSNDDGVNAGAKTEAMRRRERIARRTSKELKHGYYVNLGVGQFPVNDNKKALLTFLFIGIPTLAPSFLSPETKVWIQSENGVLGMVGVSYIYPC